eukprot:scaffold190136_cov28-Attheya_sp.AAC.1
MLVRGSMGPLGMWRNPWMSFLRPTLYANPMMQRLPPIQSLMFFDREAKRLWYAPMQDTALEWTGLSWSAIVLV